MRKVAYTMKQLEEEKLLLRTEIDLCADDFKRSLGTTGTRFKSNFTSKLGIGSAVLGLTTLGFKKWFGGKNKQESNNGSSILFTLLPIGFQLVQSYFEGNKGSEKAA